MKSKIAVLLVASTLSTLATLSSCSLFQKTTIDKEKVKTAEQSSSSQKVLFTDSGKVTTTRQWSFGNPSLQTSDLPRFIPKDPPAPGSPDKDYRDAFFSLREQYQQLLNVTKNGWAMMTEQISETKGQSLAATADQKNEIRTEQQQQHTEKRPDTTFLLILCAVFAAGFIIIIVYLIVLSRKVNSNIKIYETLKRNLPQGQ